MVMVRPLVLLLLVQAAYATPLDDYVSKPEPDFAWRDTGDTVWPLLFGGKAYILNVTSLRWMDESRAYSPNGALWSHQVAVVVPRTLKITNVSIAVMTGGCIGDKPPGIKDEYLEVADRLAHNTGSVAVVIYQIPNCPITFPSDPSHRGRGEDALIAWAWLQYIKDPAHDPEWLPRLPMTKAGMQCMRAVQEYLHQKNVATITGWVVSGASKRGWTTWTVGAVTCETCVKIIGIAPLVPIVPDIIAEVHRQWRSYGGFTFAFKDYTEVNMTKYIDGPEFVEATKIIDPVHYSESLSRIPKVVVLSSDDEFMQMDWSNIWYDKLSGEKHLLIAPNSEHSLTTGIPEVVSTMSAFYTSIVYQTKRPSFEYSIDNTTGELSVTIPQDVPHGKVVLRHAQTFSTKMRDFRWVRLAGPAGTANCSLPEIKLKKPMDGGNCVVPIVWAGTTLNEVAGSPGLFRATPPEPKTGHWTGYYIEVYFPSNVGEYQLTTPGFAWPNTLPFEDCHGESCIGRLV